MECTWRKNWIRLCFVIFLAVVQLCSASVILRTLDCSHGPLNCSAYYVKGNNCSDPVLEKEFPYLYHRPEGLFPGKPKDFQVEPFERKLGNQFYPGATLKITTPVTASVKDTKGFEVKFHPVSDFTVSSMRCLIFKFHSNLTAQDTKKDISVELHPLFGDEFYFETYALPKPPPSEDSNMFLWFFLKTPAGGFSLSRGSADWVTTISYLNDSKNQEIFFTFVAPPGNYNFTQYNVELWNNTHRLKNETIHTLHYTFTNLQPGKYKVTVQPNDPYWQDNRKCLCKDDKMRCKPCIFTRTANIEIKPTTPTSTKGSPSPSSLAPPQAGEVRVQSTESPPAGITQESVMAIVFGIIAGVALVTILGFLIHQQARKKKENPRKFEPPRHDNNHNFPLPEDNGSYVNTALDSDITNNEHRILPVKKIYIVYAEDHPAHVDVIKTFAQLLNAHCRCDVIFAPWCMSEVNQDKLRWIMRSYDNANYTVIINSVSAYKQFKAGKRLRSSHDSPLADLFYPSINQIHHRVCLNSEYGKVINVCFDYTKKEFFIDEICAGAQYILLKHLQEFLCHIHGLNQQTTRMRDVNLAFVEDVSVLPEGNKLVAAIKEAHNYEKAHPRWFEEDYLDSGVDSTDFPQEEREIIRHEYERRQRELPTEDSISKVIENKQKMVWNIPCEPHRFEPESSIAFTYNGEENERVDELGAPSFVAPSVIDDMNPDVCSSYLCDQIQELNEKYQEETQIHLTLGAGLMDDEGSESQSLGGKSV